MKQRKPIFLIVLLSVILLLEIIYYFQKNDVTFTINQKRSTEAEIKDELIINFFMEHIKSDSSTFYDKYFSSPLAYYNYEMKIIDIKKNYPEAGIIYITIGSTPMIGAHNPVGYDELIYKVDVFANITLEKFTHLKSFDIPEWLRTNIIESYP